MARIMAELRNAYSHNYEEASQKQLRQSLAYAIPRPEETLRTGCDLTLLIVRVDLAPYLCLYGSTVILLGFGRAISPS
jgi:hypothetical protein